MIMRTALSKVLITLGLAFQHLTVRILPLPVPMGLGLASQDWPAVAADDRELGSSLSKEEILFRSFIEKYNKTYSIGTPEYIKRFRIFTESLPKYEVLNAAANHPHQAVYGITKFSDLSLEEFRTAYLGHIGLQSNVQSRLPYKKKLLRFAKSIPKHYDLREATPPVLTQVRNQKTCGACWAFSVVETIETKVAMKTKKLTELSAQELVDCGTAAGDSGCHGGVPCKTLSWLNTTKTRVVPEDRYPYQAKKGLCKVTTNYTDSATVSNYSCGDYTQNEALVMPTVLYKEGPLSIAVDAESWQYYLGGIIQYHCTPKYLNHAVQIVGYDKTGEIPFYIVRNSWGTNWGIDGYLYIKIGNNVCGVASTVQTVTV